MENEISLGVQLSVELNVMTLGKISWSSEPPSIREMTDAWIRDHCIKICFGIAALNGIEGGVLFFSGADGKVYRDLDFKVKLPCAIGKNNSDFVQLVSTDNLILITFEEVVIMAIPKIFIVNSLLGKALAEYGSAVKDFAGSKSDIEINISSSNGEYKLPIIATVAKHWFKYENTAVKLMATLIQGEEDFPLDLGASSE